MTEVRVLGLDPGSRHTGYGCIAGSRDRWQLVRHGRISCPARTALSDRLLLLTEELEAVLEQLCPDVVVLEKAFHGVNPRSLIVLAQARGALLLTVARRRLPIEECTPAEVKNTVAGNGRADKRQVARMVRMLLRVDSGETLSEDASDALAVALSYAARRPMAAAVAEQARRERAR